MALSNYQFSWSPSWLSSPFTFGGAGSPWQIIDLDGLEGLPDLRTQDSERGYNDGMFSGRDFYSARTLTFTIYTFASQTASAQANFNTLQQALAPQQSGTSLLQFQLSPSDTPKRLYGRVRTRRTTIDPEYTFGYIRSQITIYCPDPRYYDETASTATLSPQSAVGRTYNRTYNLTYGLSSAANTVAVTNAGWASVGPQITIVGPAVNPTIVNQTTNQSITINGTLAATDTLVMDLDLKAVTLNGSSARNLLAGNSQWFSVPPGTSNIYFNATGVQYGSTLATITYRSAYV